MAAISPPSNTINDLLDDSLIEIFCRLPCKSLFTCKSVSKRWSSLVSDPKFHCLYLSHQLSVFRNLQARGEDLDHRCFILNPFNALVITPKLPSLHFGSLENHLRLSFLGPDFEPTYVVPHLRSVFKFVFGCSNGLVLCGNPRPQQQCKYYVCNPVTRDSLELPCSPSVCDNDGVLVGFTCDPYYHVEAEGVSVSVDSKRRFRVVRIPAFSETKFSFIAEVFFSETGQWKELAVPCPQGFACGFFLTASSVAHNGRLYFTGRMRILVYDPYNCGEFASVIDYPSDFGEQYRGCIGVSCGRLQLSEFPVARPVSIGPYSGRIWELEHCDRETGEAAAWRLVHEYYLPDIVGPMFEELKAIERESVRGYGRILAFHPSVEGAVFLEFGDHILYCNLLTQRFKAAKYGGLSLGFYPVTMVELPWWPTPIPSIPSPVDHCV